MKKIFYFFVKLIFVFAIFFDINFTFLPSITTARICFLVLLLVSVNKKKVFAKTFYNFLFSLSLVFLVALIQYSFSSDSAQLSRLLWFTLYSIIAPFLFISFIKSRNELLYLISFAVALQAILTILSFINPSIKALFYNLIIFTSNFDEDQVLRAFAFASIGGAGLSVIQSIGVISSLVLLKINNNGFYRTILLWFVIIIIIVSIVLIGRTGLFISFFSLIIYFINQIKKIKNIVLISLISVTIYQVNLISILENLTSGINGFSVDVFTEWIENAFKLKNNDTSEALASMPIPPINLQTIIGTGRVVHESGIGNASGNDSGYIQTYYSLGLLISVFFYTIYILFLRNQINRTSSKSLYILLFIMFTIEIKEPFIFQYVFPFFVLSIILVSNKIKINSDSRLYIE
jgi:hypothetical protein